MKVKELIEALQKWDLEDEIWVYDLNDEDCYIPDQNIRKISIEGESTLCIFIRQRADGN